MFKPLSCLRNIKDVLPEESRVGLLRRYVYKDEDTSDIEYLTVPWRSVCFLVVLNWFLCTDAANDNTSIVLCSCGIPPKHFSVMPECVRKFHHLS